jgi:hypothetical protein
VNEFGYDEPDGVEPEGESPLIQYLVATVGCAVCGESYGAEDIDVLDHRGDAWIIMLACPHCGTRGLVLAMVADRGRPQIIGEVSEADAEELDELPPISGDDVLDWHKFLQNYDGDLNSLLGIGD